MPSRCLFFLYFFLFFDQYLGAVSNSLSRLNISQTSREFGGTPTSFFNYIPTQLPRFPQKNEPAQHLLDIYISSSPNIVIAGSGCWIDLAQSDAAETRRGPEVTKQTLPQEKQQLPWSKSYNQVHFVVVRAHQAFIRDWAIQRRI
ncbi:hypothetical protein EDB92DRAFT_1908923 [Lactarius akahatsu]|uniref:Secreted protein n=1 Tax=Lactarius akahatsu TaxID=416441 RepID=A0AAD4L584_9AGAM|nr:hypothetical protein EDB92DRAFT_1908923 [Lactarius akahatsu]